jgi:hypothetical protein
VAWGSGLTETTSLIIKDVYNKPPKEVRKSMNDAVKKLLKKSKVTVIYRRYVGIADIDTTVSEVCVEKLSEAIQMEVQNMH